MFRKGLSAFKNTNEKRTKELEEVQQWKLFYWPSIIAAHPPDSNIDDWLTVNETAIDRVKET